MVNMLTARVVPAYLNLARQHTTRSVVVLSYTTLVSVRTPLAP